MTTSFESGCSAYHIGQQEAAADSRVYSACLDDAVEEMLSNSSSRTIEEVATDCEVLIVDIQARIDDELDAEQAHSESQYDY